MADLRIVDAPVLLQESITDDVKMPTGGLGNFSIRLGDIVWYVVTKEQLASKGYVDLSSKGVKDSLDEHIADETNPHRVTKAQVGLGNVDNTADIDKPISNATKSAIITATDDMATKSYVNQKDNLKADVAYVDGKDGDLTTLKTTDKTNLVKSINEVYDDTKGVVALYDKNVVAGAGANGWTTDLVEEDGLTQRVINALNIRCVGSVADLTSVKNPRDGQIVFVKSYYANVNTGTHHRIYRLSKAAVNNGTTCINGWELYFSGTKYISTAAVGLKTGQSCVKAIRDSIAFLNSKGGGTLNIEDGEYLLDAANLTVKNSANNLYTDERYWFLAADNITIQGTRKAVLKVEDNIINLDKDKLTPKGYQIFIDNYKTVNFTIKGFTIDCNGANNLLAAPSERTHEAAAHVIYFYQTTNVTMTDMMIKNHSGSNPIVFDYYCQLVKISNCVFAEMGMKGVGNTHQTDHSTIYIACDNYEVSNNQFINTDTGKYAGCTAIELHGSYASVYGNTIKNFDNPFIQAAAPAKCLDVKFFNNNCTGVVSAISLWGGGNNDIKAYITNNTFEFLKDTTLETSVLTTMGTITDYHTGYAECYMANNTFIGNGTTVYGRGGRLDVLTSLNNTFENLKTGMFIGKASNSKQTRFIFKDVYVNCSFNTFMRFEESAWGYTPQDAAQAERLTTADDNFTVDIDCSFIKQQTPFDFINSTQLRWLRMTGRVVLNSDNKIRVYNGPFNHVRFNFEVKALETTGAHNEGVPENIVGKFTAADGTYYEKLKGRIRMLSRRYADAKPTVSQSGADIQGDIVYNTNPVDCVGWICTRSSTGADTWKPFGVITA